MAEIVFVYGSLKRGLPNHHLLRDSEFIGEAITDSPEFRMGNVGAFPEITRTQSSARGYITGEVFACQRSVLNELDQLESNGEWYRREKILLRINRFDQDAKEFDDGNDCIRGWIYVWLRPKHPDVKPFRIENGFPVYCWNSPDDAAKIEPE